MCKIKTKQYWHNYVLFLAPPSPLTMTHEMPDQNHIGMHTLGRNISRYTNMQAKHFQLFIFFHSHKCAHLSRTCKYDIIKINARTTAFSFIFLAVYMWLQKSLENIFTDLDHSHHHCHRHHQMMMRINILAGQERNQLAHWLQLCQKIKIYQVGYQRITSKKVLNL